MDMNDDPAADAPTEDAPLDDGTGDDKCKYIIKCLVLSRDTGGFAIYAPLTIRVPN